MADECSSLSEVLRHYNRSKKLLTELIFNDRVLIAYITNLLEKHKKGKVDIHSDEIKQILDDKTNFFTEVDCVKNQLEELKNKLDKLQLDEWTENRLRENRGRKKSNAGISVDSGFSSATSNVLTDSSLLSINLPDDVQKEATPIQETTSHTADSVQKNDIFVLPQEPSCSNLVTLNDSLLETKTQDISLMPEILVEDYSDKFEKNNDVCGKPLSEQVQNSPPSDKCHPVISPSETATHDTNACNTDDHATNSCDIGVLNSNESHEKESSEDGVREKNSSLQNIEPTEHEDTTHSTVI